MNMKHMLYKGIQILVILAVILTFTFTAFPGNQVYAAAKTIHLKDTKIVLLEGDTHTLQLLNKSDKVISASKVTWTTSSKSVAKVSKTGVITAVGDGLATITAKYNKKKYTAKVYVYEKAQVDYAEIYEPIQAKHKEMTEVDMSKVIDIKKYAVNNSGDYNLLTNEEIKTLLNKNREKKQTLTCEEALYDLDVLMRTLKSSYAGYYYFGEESYKQAEANLITWVSEQETVKVTEFQKVMRQEFDFMRDAHAAIAQKTQVLDGFKYNYYYCEKQEFQKDEIGYYKLAKDKKWYFQSFNDDRVMMEPTLTEDGRLIYSPVLWCPASEVKSCKMTLKNSAGTKRTETITWIMAKSYLKKGTPEPDFNYFDENGLVYLSVRCFDNDPKYAKELQDYVNSGRLARNAKILIIDTRSNGGGNSKFSDSFYKNLTGFDPQYPVSNYNRSSKLASAAGITNSGIFHNKPKFLNNDIPIILLTDDLSGSSGEHVMYAALGYDNVLVVGSNTAGYQLTGNAFHIALPNSGIGCGITSTLKFFYHDQNIDGKGYKPDIWCNPMNALDAVYALIENYNLYDADSITAMKENTKALNNPAQIPYVEYWMINGKQAVETNGTCLYVIDSEGLVLTVDVNKDSRKKAKQYLIEVSTSEDFSYDSTKKYWFSQDSIGNKQITVDSTKTYYIRGRVLYDTPGVVDFGKWSKIQTFTSTIFN